MTSESNTQTDPQSEELNLSVKVDSPSACERHVIVTIPRADVDRYYRNAYGEIQPKAELPGFRPGKAPRKLVQSMFKDQVSDQVKSSLLMDSLQQVTEGEHFSAISEPDLDYGAVEIPKEGDFTYEFKIEVRPEFDIPNYESLNLTRPTYTVSVNDVERQLAKTLARFSMGEDVVDAVELGDGLLVDIVFKSDGKVLSEIFQENVVLREKLSLADAVIEDFGSQIVGASEGESRTFTFKMADDCEAEEYRGKEIEAVVTLVSATRFSPTKLTTSTLNKLGFDTQEELTDFVREELSNQFEYHQRLQLREQITTELLKDANWEMPESLVQRQTNRELQRQSLELIRSGFSKDQVGSYLNSSRRNLRASTEKALREHFILEKIAESQNIEPTSEEYDVEIKAIAEQSDASERSVRAKLEKSGQMDALRNQIVERKVVDMIVEAANVTDEALAEFFTGEDDEAVLEYTVVPVERALPEAKYDEQPQDGQKEGATMKPTP